MTPGDTFQKVTHVEVFFYRWSEHMNLKYKQWKEGGGKDRKDDEDEKTIKVPNSDRIADGYVFGIHYTYVTEKVMYRFKFLSMCMFMTSWPRLIFCQCTQALKLAFNRGTETMSGISVHRSIR